MNYYPEPDSHIRDIVKVVLDLSDCNETRIHNHLLCKQTLNHLAKLAK